MSEIAERLRGLHGDMPWNDQLAVFEEAAARIEQLEAALREVMVGGNHLAVVLGIGHLAAGSSYEAALEFYGPGPNYDVWCCWNAIMQARAALEDK